MPTVFSGIPPARVWDDIVDIICERRERCGERGVDAIVISFPGPVRDGRFPLAAPTIAGAAAPQDIASKIAERARLPVHLLNDVSAAAWYIGEHCDDDRFLVITISSGIGSKIYDRARRDRIIDDQPFAGEIGHVTVDTSGASPMCDCGQRGHLGAIASGRGTQRLARARAALEPDLFRASVCAARYGASPATIENEAHLVPAARDGDPWARGVIRDAMRPLAIALITVVHACALRRIVVVGGFAAALGDWYVQELQAMMLAASGPAFGVPSDLVRRWNAGDEVCLRGAAEFARALPLLTA